MTAAELVRFLGRRVAVREPWGAWHGDVIDAKSAYGTLRLHVAPVAGTGSVWVEVTRTSEV